jgi:hypothetical protein
MGIIKFEDFSIQEEDNTEVEAANEAAQKFTRSSAGMIQVGAKTPFKTDVKIKKEQWDAMFTKINNLPSAKRGEIIKKLHGLGLM